MNYCMHCGNTGVMAINGLSCTYCKASVNVDDNVDLTCLDIPMAYRGAIFNSELLPSGFGNMYPTYMSKLYRDITSLRPMSTNIFLCSPPQSGKTVFVYSCMEFLFKKNIDVFPLFDVSELETIMRDTDKGKKCIHLTNDMKISSLYEAQYLFVRVPDKLDYSTPETMAQIVDRGVRRGNSTIFISNRSWQDLIKFDTAGLLKGMLGDGSYKSILNKSFWKEK